MTVKRRTRETNTVRLPVGDPIRRNILDEIAEKIYVGLLGQVFSVTPELLRQLQALALAGEPAHYPSTMRG
jgi:hypothetical protein